MSQVKAWYRGHGVLGSKYCKGVTHGYNKTTDPEHTVCGLPVTKNWLRYEGIRPANVTCRRCRRIMLKPSIDPEEVTS